VNTFLAILTYFAYCFIIGAYTVKIVKYLRLPTHLRWELYPVIHEEKYAYGGSYFEKKEWWNEEKQKRYVRGILYLLKEYFTLGDYLTRNVLYWLGLFPWHIGFILIITFHILCFFGALFMVLEFTISPGSPDLWGRILFYAILITGIVSFIAGTVGSIFIIINRIIDKSLRTYATPLNFLMYIFTLVVFISGLYSWYFIDPDMKEYREFWKGLITFHFVGVDVGTMVHIILFDLFLIYLPFTRSLHYITRLFAFFLIRWDDEPNRRGSKLEKRLIKNLNQKVGWQGPHIGAGRSWNELARYDR